MSELRIGSLCTGYGGLDMAVLEAFGGELAWVADSDPGAVAILAHHHPEVPNLGDITAVDFTQVEPVDVLCAGFPCQDISNAGRREGIQEGNRSGLWFRVEGAIEALGPSIVILENVAAIRTRGLGVVLEGLARLGFDAEWACVRADEVGGPHQRRRWILLAAAADSADLGHERGGQARDRRSGSPDGGLPASHPAIPGLEGLPGAGGAAAAASVRRSEFLIEGGIDWGKYEPAIRRWEAVTGRRAPYPREPAPRGGERLAPVFAEWMMGLPLGHVTAVPGLSRNQQLKAIGNGVVPQQGVHALLELLRRFA